MGKNSAHLFIYTNFFKGSENTNISKQSDLSKIDDLDKDENKEDKKDEPTDEEKKLLDGKFQNAFHSFYTPAATHSF